MADTSVPNLTELTSPATGDLLHIVDVSASADPKDRKITVQNLLEYTKYVALLTQTGTDAPTATVVKNDTGATVTLSRLLAGIYQLTFSQAVLTSNKTVCLITPSSTLYTYVMQVNSTTEIYVSTTDFSNVGTDSVLSNTPVIIRIYV